MDAVPRELRVYEESPGQVPFLRWLKGLADFRVRKALQVRLDRWKLEILVTTNRSAGVSVN